MVAVLRGRYKKRCDPNKYAAERIAIPVTKARLAAYLTNTVEAWSRFMDVWPTESCDAEAAIARLRYSPHMRKLVSNFFWIGWAAVASLFVGIVLFGHQLLAP
jgi:hypothetical protein